LLPMHGLKLVPFLVAAIQIQPDDEPAALNDQDYAALFRRDPEFVSAFVEFCRRDIRRRLETLRVNEERKLTSKVTKAERWDKVVDYVCRFELCINPFPEPIPYADILCHIEKRAELPKVGSKQHGKQRYGVVKRNVARLSKGQTPWS
ncbi:MAG: hypothetical protein ACKVHP_14675, partial [Verrucomicrobiales bacterium]